MPRGLWEPLSVLGGFGQKPSTTKAQCFWGNPPKNKTLKQKHQRFPKPRGKTPKHKPRKNPDDQNNQSVRQNVPGGLLSETLGFCFFSVFPVFFWLCAPGALGLFGFFGFFPKPLSALWQKNQKTSDQKAKTKDSQNPRGTTPKQLRKKTLKTK